jgi:hypothetical protein
MLDFCDAVGAQAVVFGGVYRGNDVAIKVMHEGADGSFMRDFSKELSVMKVLHCTLLGTSFAVRF